MNVKLSFFPRVLVGIQVNKSNIETAADMYLYIIHSYREISDNTIHHFSFSSVTYKSMHDASRTYVEQI